MSATKNDVGIPQNKWINLYTSSSITVGTAVDIFNKGYNMCFICSSTNEPTTNNIGVQIFPGPVGNYLRATSGEPGLWAYCPNGVSTLLIQN